MHCPHAAQLAQMTSEMKAGDSGRGSLPTSLPARQVSEKYECQHCNYANIFRTPIICPDSSSSSTGRATQREREMGQRRQRMHRCEWYKRHNNGLTGKGELMMSSPTMAAVDKPTRSRTEDANDDDDDDVDNGVKWLKRTRGGSIRLWEYLQQMGCTRL